MTTPEYNALDRQLRQLQLERFQGLHAYSERATEENERQIEVVRRQMAKLRQRVGAVQRQIATVLPQVEDQASHR
jgi:hypothetical protein